MGVEPGNGERGCHLVGPPLTTTKQPPPSRCGKAGAFVFGGEGVRATVQALAWWQPRNLAARRREVTPSRTPPIIIKKGVCVGWPKPRGGVYAAGTTN